jgi:hypothetical protein
VAVSFIGGVPRENNQPAAWCLGIVDGEITNFYNIMLRIKENQTNNL